MSFIHSSDTWCWMMNSISSCRGVPSAPPESGGCAASSRVELQVAAVGQPVGRSVTMPGSRSCVLMGAGRDERPRVYARRSPVRARAGRPGRRAGGARAALAATRRIARDPAAAPFATIRSHVALRSPLSSPPSPRRCSLAGCGSDAAQRAQPRARANAGCPNLADRRAMRHAGSAGGSRASPAAARSGIFAAVLPANTVTPKDDPLVILAGGPGQAASYLAPVRGAPHGAAPHARRRAHRPARHRPLVAVDLRGVQAARRRRVRRSIRCRARASAWPRSRRRASISRSTRRPRGSPTSRRCARRWATRAGTCGAAATARASRRSTCAGIRTACAR